jgi:hypothetical protein
VRIGAMSHFLLPGHGGADRPSDKPGMYGADAMQLLVDGLAQHGVPLIQCQGKIFGGGAMFPRNSGTRHRHAERRLCAQMLQQARHTRGVRKPVRRRPPSSDLHHPQRRGVEPAGSARAGMGRRRSKDGMSDIKVMIVDDSAVVRQVLSGLLNAAPGITVTHAVANPCWPWSA